MPRQYFVYILTNINNKVLYTGVTNDLSRRVWEHRGKLVDGFTKKYNLTKLVYCEETDKIEDAIAREKQIKGWLRKKKNLLVESANPGWKDLAEELVCYPEGTEGSRIKGLDPSLALKDDKLRQILRENGSE